MGVRIVAKDVDAEAYATEYSAPVRRGLEGIHFLNTTPQKAARNYAPGKKSGTVVGSPVAKADRLSTVGLVSYIQSEVAETDSMTIFCIARSGDANANAATRPGFFGTFRGLAADGGVADGLIMFFSTAGSIAVNAGFGNTEADKTSPRAALSDANASSWALYQVTVSSAGITFRDVTNNRSQTTAVTNGLPRRRSLSKFRLGSTFNDFAGTCDLAVWQAHSVILSDEEISATIADLRSYAARKGISV
ncbi:hypothetical protein [Pseudomonas sp. NBRC 111128]|uniref:hypothetical protein n=1 Tax=Pseudomonas sp. NBRC 111128 TaxID=1661043 RepID=UPI0006D3DED9|nr:hypothetical protein [Pseudomonas sp. NBRC 111128]